jgi:hypothetical protein
VKFGQFEGSPEEIKNFFQDNGLKVEDFLNPPEKPIRTLWFVVPSVLVVIAIAAFTVFTPSAAGALLFVFLLGCASSLWLAVNVQLRFKNAVATGIVAVGLLLLLLVATGVLTPKEMLPTIKELRSESR